MNSIAVVGAGVQAIAHSKCLIEENWDVKIYNRSDDYKNKALKEGLEILNINNGVKEEIIYLLVGDDVHGLVYENFIKPYQTEKTIIIVAHSYSYYSKTFKPSKNISVGMIAPRMPGSPILKAKREGKGVPAFWDVIQGDFKYVESIIMNIARDIGYTKSYFRQVPWSEECEVDLFIEQYFLPRLITLIDQTFNYLIKKGFKKETALYELFQSGELGMLLSEAANKGLLETWVNNASPTCRFGLNEALVDFNSKFGEEKIMNSVLDNIRNGSFLERLNRDTQTNMKITKDMESKFLNNKMSKASEKIRKTYNSKI